MGCAKTHVGFASRVWTPLAPTSPTSNRRQSRPMSRKSAKHGGYPPLSRGRRDTGVTVGAQLRLGRSTLSPMKNAPPKRCVFLPQRRPRLVAHVLHLLHLRQKLGVLLVLVLNKSVAGRGGNDATGGATEAAKREIESDAAGGSNRQNGDAKRQAKGCLSRRAVSRTAQSRLQCDARAKQKLKLSKVPTRRKACRATSCVNTQVAPAH